MRFSWENLAVCHLTFLLRAKRVAYSEYSLVIFRCLQQRTCDTCDQRFKSKYIKRRKQNGIVTITKLRWPRRATLNFHTAIFFLYKISYCHLFLYKISDCHLFFDKISDCYIFFSTKFQTKFQTVIFFLDKTLNCYFFSLQNFRLSISCRQNFRLSSFFTDD